MKVKSYLVFLFLCLLSFQVFSWDNWCDLSPEQRYVCRSLYKRSQPNIPPSLFCPPFYAIADIINTCKDQLVDQYDLCQEGQWDEIGDVINILKDRFEKVLKESPEDKYAKIFSERFDKTYLVKRPIVGNPKISLQQIGQQIYWICLAISSQKNN